MNFKVNESATKLRGGYYTQPDIAAFLLRWIAECKPKNVLEPSCGDGAFIRQARDSGLAPSAKLTGFEIDSEEAEKARGAGVSAGCDVRILNQDFLRWALLNLPGGERFDAVVGNPPFIRYQYLDATLQDESERIFNYFDLKFTRHTNAWVPFVIASLGLLRPGGRLGMVVPAELLHVLHAQPLRTYLAKECSRVLVFDPQEIWFEDTLQGAMLLLAEKKQTPVDRGWGVAIHPTTSRAFLSDNPEDYFTTAEYANGEVIKGKWTHALLTPKERALLKHALDEGVAARFKDIASVDVGIVTGANKFFLVDQSTVNEYALHEWSHPMFGRSEHVPGVIYDKQTHDDNADAGLPTNFLWFPEGEFKRLPSNAQHYIKLGEADDLHVRYKCRVRTPWYRVPSVYTAPVAMLKRSHDYPRLVLNAANAYTTDTAYRIVPLAMKAHALVYSFVNSLTALSCELEGRSYGGGVLELVPSEIERVIVPAYDASIEDVTGLDSRVRTLSSDDVLLVQDQDTLSAIGFTRNDSASLHDAWSRLRTRRHRKTPESVDVD